MNNNTFSKDFLFAEYQEIAAKSKSTRKKLFALENRSDNYWSYLHSAGKQELTSMIVVPLLGTILFVSLAALIYVGVFGIFMGLHWSLAYLIYIAIAVVCFRIPLILIPRTIARLHFYSSKARKLPSFNKLTTDELLELVITHKESTISEEEKRLLTAISEQKNKLQTSIQDVAKLLVKYGATLSNYGATTNHLAKTRAANLERLSGSLQEKYQSLCTYEEEVEKYIYTISQEITKFSAFQTAQQEALKLTRAYMTNEQFEEEFQVLKDQFNDLAKSITEFKAKSIEFKQNVESQVLAIDEVHQLSLT